MAGDFFDRIDELEERVGRGTLRGQVEVDQVYAKYQHERIDLRHPQGGGAHYLSGPFLTSVEDNMRHLAKTLLEPGGPGEGMRTVVETTSQAVYDHAPWEFGDLRASGHPSVTDDDVTVYDRPPHMHRLTEDELRAKGHLRTLGFGS